MYETPARHRARSCAASSTCWRAIAPSSSRASAELRTTLDEVARAGSGGARAACLRERARIEGRARATAPAFPAALTDARAFAIARAMLDGFNRHYRLFRRGQRRGQAALRGGRLARPAAGPARAHRVLRPARRRGGRAAGEASSRPATLPMDVWQQVKLHYIGLLVNHHQPELAETFFNSVTTKILHRTLLPQRLHLRAPGDLAPSTSRTTSRRRADLPRLLPDARRRWPTTVAAHRRQLPAAARVRRPAAATSTACWRRCARSFGEVKLRANFQIQVLSSLFFRNKGAYVVGKIINGFIETPFALPILHNERGQLLRRRRAVRRGRPADAVQLRARLLHGRHGGAVGLRAVPALADAAQAALRDLQRARPAEAGQDLFYRDFLLPPAPFDATSSASRPASRAW